MSYVNQLAAFRITGTWQEHLDRGSLGGLDYNTPVGTPLRAPSDCRILNIPNNGTGGHTVTMFFSDGTRDQYMHLSRFVSPGNYRQGQIIGYSGGAVGSAGAGESSGPHAHWHKILANGKRVNPLNYLTGVAGVGPSTGKRKTMSTMYWCKDVNGSQGKVFALAGDGTGRAGWLETSSQDFANSLAAIHGNAIELSAGTWDAWKSAYLSGSVSGGVGASPAQVAAAVDAALADNFDAIPTAEENAAALGKAITG
jgi:Peptidase family M23